MGGQQQRQNNDNDDDNDNNDDNNDDNNNGVAGGRKRERLDPSRDTVLVVPARQKLTNVSGHPTGDALLTLSGGRQQKDWQERVVVIVGGKGGACPVARECVREQGRSQPPVLEPR